MRSDQGFLLQAIVDNFPGGISVMDSDLRVIFANHTMRQILDLPDSLFAGGPPLLEELFRFNAGRRDYGPGDIEKLVAERMALAKARKPHEFERRRPDGTTVEVRGVPVEGGGFVTTYVDITERRRSEARVEHMAHHDALTGVAQSRVVLSTLGRSARAYRPQRQSRRALSRPRPFQKRQRYAWPPDW